MTKQASADIPDAVVHTALGTSTTTPWAISKTLPAAFDESLSYLEMLMAILAKQNELVAKMNDVIDVLELHESEIGDLYDITSKLREDLEAAINDYNTKITNLRTEINERIDQEVDTLNSRIDKEIADLISRIESEVATLNSRITSVYNELLNLINNNFNTLDEKINSVNATLDAKIDNQIAALKDAMEDCRSELISYIDTKYTDLLTHSDLRDDQLQYNLNAVYNLLMAGALTAEEYDALEISAENYDSGAANKINGYQLTAHDYDTNGKYYLQGQDENSTTGDGDPVIATYKLSDLFTKNKPLVYFTWFSGGAGMQRLTYDHIEAGWGTHEKLSGFRTYNTTTSNCEPILQITKHGMILSGCFTLYATSSFNPTDYETFDSPVCTSIEATLLDKDTCATLTELGAEGLLANVNYSGLSPIVSTIYNSSGEMGNFTYVYNECSSAFDLYYDTSTNTLKIHNIAYADMNMGGTYYGFEHLLDIDADSTTGLYTTKLYIKIPPVYIRPYQGGNS